MRSSDARPSVSVVIATKDRPEPLRRAIDAVLAQAYDGPIECIVVFDQAPIDRSLEGENVRVLANSRTPGLAGARNTGIEASTGSIIGFCDDDDTWAPDKLRLQIAALQSYTDVVVTGIRVCYEDRVIPRVPLPSDLTIQQLARRRVTAAHPSTVLVRRSALLERIGLVDEDIPGSYGEDYDWLLRAAQAGPIAVVGLPLVDVTWGAQSYFQQRWRIIIDSIDYMLAKHPMLAASRPGHAWLLGRKAFAFAASGARGSALYWALRCWLRNPLERRVYVTLLVALGLVSADRLLRLAHSRGRGI